MTGLLHPTRPLLSRRQALALLGAASTGLLFPVRTVASQPAEPAPSVVVVGGGLAGLAAALTLARANVAVQLLEASDRVGGRVLTVRAPFDDQLFAEAGGELIDADHVVIRRYLRAYGIVVRHIPDAPGMFYLRGQLQRGRSLADYGRRVQGDANRVAEQGFNLRSLVPDPYQAWSGPAAGDLDAQSFGDWLDRLQPDPIVRAYHRVNTMNDYGVEADSLSLLQYARDQRLEQKEHDNDVEALRVHDGLDRLVESMAADLGSRIHLQSPVMGIHQDDDVVTVRYTSDSVTRSLEARYVVIAVPFTVLRSLRVTPAFRQERQDALGSLRYCHAVKVMIQFGRRFWQDLGVSGATATDLPFQFAWNATKGQPGVRGIMTLFMTGQSAVEMAGLSESDRLTRSIDQLQQIYPGCRQFVESGVSFVWDAVPTSLGGYSYFAPGELLRYAPILAQPEGRVHFAGEHTDRWQATMNGALASGDRAGQEILARLA